MWRRWRCWGRSFHRRQGCSGNSWQLEGMARPGATWHKTESWGGHVEEDAAGHWLLTGSLRLCRALAPRAPS
eukprot:1816522-Amphidinium_carterae.1